MTRKVDLQLLKSHPIIRYVALMICDSRVPFTNEIDFTGALLKKLDMIILLFHDQQTSKCILILIQLYFSEAKSETCAIHLSSSMTSSKTSSTTSSSSSQLIRPSSGYSFTYSNILNPSYQVTNNSYKRRRSVSRGTSPINTISPNTTSVSLQTSNVLHHHQPQPSTVRVLPSPVPTPYYQTRARVGLHLCNICICEL